MVRKNAIPFHGTLIRAAINYDIDSLLEKALIFKGHLHTPGFDFIDRIYQTNSDEIEFKVSSEINDFGSREAGRLARTKIENLMDGGKNPIHFDFSEIHLISSSFADEVFGKLILLLGVEKYKKFIRFSYIDFTVQNLINKAVILRQKQIEEDYLTFLR